MINQIITSMDGKTIKRFRLRQHRSAEEKLDGQRAFIDKEGSYGRGGYPIVAQHFLKSFMINTKYDGERW